MPSKFRPKVPTLTDASIFKKLKNEGGWYEQAKIKGQRLIIADGIAYDGSGQEFEGHTKQILGSVVEELSYVFNEKIYDIVFIEHRPNIGKVALIDIPSVDKPYNIRHLIIKASLPCASAGEPLIKYDPVVALPSIELSPDRKKGDLWKDMREFSDSLHDLPFSGVVLKHGDQRYQYQKEGNDKDNWWAVKF
jgi:hypothetical protein